MKLLNRDNVERSSNKRTCRDYNHHPKSVTIWIRHSPDYNKHCIPKSRYPLDIDTLKEAARDSFEGIFDTFFEQFHQ